MGNFIYSNPLGAYAFLALIPFIIIYLRRPKPADATVPSLMFFFGDKGLTRQNFFLRQLIQNLIFFIQLIIICALAFSVAEPYIQVPQNLSNEVNILIIDASASSQTIQGTRTRFQQELTEAGNFLNGKISIILAENIPLVALENGNPEKARQVLSEIRPGDTPTNLGDAMLLASDMLEGKRGRVAVFSDFITTTGPDILVAMRLLASRHNEVKLVNVRENGSNVGIVDVTADKYESKVFVKNFNSDTRKVSARITNSNKEILNWERELPAGSIEVISFDTKTGLTKVELTEKDSLPVDDIAFISYPAKEKIDVLLITNEEQSNLKTALLSSKEVRLSIAKPPVIPSLNYDVIIMHKFKKEYLLPGFFEDVARKVASGSSFILTAQDGLDESFSDVLPVEISGVGKDSNVNVNIINQFSKDMEFGMVSKYLVAKPVKDAVVVASTDDNSPLIALRPQGRGEFVYYGIFDDSSSFKQSASYPIFWSNLLDFLVSTGDLSLYNYRTGKLLAAEGQVLKPSGAVVTSKIFFDEVGPYVMQNTTIAANLADAKESDINRKPQELEDQMSRFVAEPSSDKKDVDLKPYILAFALLLLAFEVYYVKRSGDI